MHDETEAPTNGESKKKTKTRAKQETIPGTGRQDRNPKIEKLASAYRDARDERMQLTEKEVAAKAELLNAMKDAGLEVYKCSDEEYDVVVEPSEETVKVKRRFSKADAE